MADSPRIITVTDALAAYRGAERVLAAVLELYPDAPVCALVRGTDSFENTALAGRLVHTSWIQRIPGGSRHYRNYLPLLPITMEQFDLRGFDIVLSFSYAVAHGVLCRPEQLHISYTHTPFRYAWHNAGDFRPLPLLAWPSNLIMHYFRLWDRAAAAGINHFVANSCWTAAGIRRAYGRSAEVIHPPVETHRFTSCRPRAEYFTAFSRLVPHKRVDLIIEAFSSLGLPLLVIGDGPERRRLQSRASANIRFLGTLSEEAVSEILGGARALVHAAEDDFGLVMAEAQAAGCPVVAYRGGAAPEIVVDGKTGVLFSEQTPSSLIGAIQQFRSRAGAIRAANCVRNAQRFDKEVFKKAFAAMVQREWSKFQRAEGSGNGG